MINVVAGILINDKDEILIAKRKEDKSMGGYWEFPGGKIEDEELPQESLIRELKEEMNIVIKVKEYFGENIYDYGDFKIRLIAYICEIIDGEISLTDHSEIKWVRREELNNYKIAPADIAFIKKLENE